MASSGAILMTAVGADGTGIFTFEDDRLISTVPIYATQGVRAETSILVGSADALPPAGVIRFAQRADSSIYPNTTQVDLFSRTVGGVQKLYAKFGNGVVREIATA